LGILDVLEDVGAEGEVRGRIGEREPVSVSDDGPARNRATGCHCDPMRRTCRLFGDNPIFGSLKCPYVGFHEDTPSTGGSERICGIPLATSDVEDDCSFNRHVKADLPHGVVGQQSMEVVRV